MSSSALPMDTDQSGTNAPTRGAGNHGSQRRPREPSAGAEENQDAASLDGDDFQDILDHDEYAGDESK